MNARARTFTYDVSLDDGWVARSALGGTPIGNEEDAWTPEHLVLAGLCRCTLTSFRYHARRAGHEPVTRAQAHGEVTRREDDGRFAFVAIRVDATVVFDPPLERDALLDLIGRGERDCFVGASLTVQPDYKWNVNGEEIR